MTSTLYHLISNPSKLSNTSKDIKMKIQWYYSNIKGGRDVVGISRYTGAKSYYFGGWEDDKDECRF